MKKRIVSIIVVMAVLATLLTGCNLITLNAERDNSQVVSTVNVDGLTGIVTKADLLGFFNQLGYMYLQYGMTPEKIITEFNTQLANKEILVLYATKFIAEDKGIAFDDVKAANNAYVANEMLKGTKRYDKDVRPFDLFKLFSPDEIMYVINQTNKSLEESYESLLEEVKNEHAANAPEEDKEEDKEEEDKKDEETLAPRKTRTYTAKTEFEPDPSITAEMVKDDYALSFFTKMDAKTLNDMEREAYNKLQKNLNKVYEDSKTAWNVLLDGQKEYRLMNKYRDEYVNNEEKDTTLVPTEAEITSRYQFTLNSDLSRITDDASYKSAFEGDQNNDLLVHNNKTGYFMVKSILLKFNKDQEKALDAIKKGAKGDTDDKYSYVYNREQLALDETYDVDAVGTDIGGIKVNVSNPNYDPEAVCEDKDCKCINCVNNPNRTTSKDCKDKDCKCVKCPNSAYDRYDIPFEDILSEMSLALAESANVKMPEDIANDPVKAAAVKVNAKMDTFTDWMYLVNDDPGMFEKSGYAVSKQGESSYVAEYVALARELEKLGTVGAVGGLVGTHNGAKVVPNPINEEDPDIIIHSYIAENGEEIDYIVNDFGIHIVMVTYIPAENDKTTKIEGSDELYRLNGDYVVNYANEYVTDEDGKPVLTEIEIAGKKIMVKEVKSLKNKTVDEKIKDKIMDEKKSDKYSKEEKDVTENKGYATEKNDKLINSIIKDIEESLKAQGYDPEHGHNHTH